MGNTASDAYDGTPFVMDVVVFTGFMQYVDTKDIPTIRLVCKTFKRWSQYHFKLALKKRKPKQCCEIIYNNTISGLKIVRCPFSISCPTHGFDESLQSDDERILNRIKCNTCDYWTLVKKNETIFCKCQRFDPAKTC